MLRQKYTWVLPPSVAQPFTGQKVKRLMMEFGLQSNRLVIEVENVWAVGVKFQNICLDFFRV